MQTREEKLLERIKNDSRVRFVAELTGGRVVIEIAIVLIAIHHALRQLRGDDERDVKPLAASVRNTGQDTLYPISLYAEVNDDDELIYYCGDGAQRLRALESNGAEKTIAQVVLRWRDERDAMEDCLSANVARFEWKPNDVYSVIRSGKLPVAKIKEVMNFTDSTMERYEAVAPHTWLCKLVDEGCIGYSRAAKWIVACGKNQEKIDALRNTLARIHDEATKSAEYYQNAEKRAPLTPKDREKKKLSYWFKDRKVELDELELALKEDDGVEKDDEGALHIRIDATKATKKLGATIGPKDEWNRVLAVNNFFGQKVSDVPRESFDLVLDHWDDIRAYIVWHRDRLLAEEYAKEHPMPTMGKQVESEEATAPATVQFPNSTVTEE